jgi:hypothetical protein
MTESKAAQAAAKVIRLNVSDGAADMPNEEACQEFSAILARAGYSCTYSDLGNHWSVGFSMEGKHG